MSEINAPAVIERLVREPGTWAVVGLSTNTARAAYRVARYLQSIGKTIVPVHPAAETVHGATGYASLADVPADTRVDVAAVIVRSELGGTVVDQATQRRAPR